MSDSVYAAGLRGRVRGGALSSQVPDEKMNAQNFEKKGRQQKSLPRWPLKRVKLITRSKRMSEWSNLGIAKEKKHMEK